MKGWVGEIVSNAWGYAAPYWASPIAPCPTGGVWILTHIWEHYLYTGDQRFLEKVFPLVEEAVEFSWSTCIRQNQENILVDRPFLRKIVSYIMGMQGRSVRLYL